MALIPAGVNAPGYSDLPAALGASFKQLVVEKLPSGQGFDLAVRDGITGFTFFNVEGHQYDYNPAAQSLAITNGRLLVSKGVSQRAWPPIRRRCNRWKNLRWRSDAANPNRPPD